MSLHDSFFAGWDWLVDRQRTEVERLRDEVVHLTLRAEAAEHELDRLQMELARQRDERGHELYQRKNGE